MKILPLLLVLQCNFLFAQINKTDSIKQHLDSLNWNSFTIAVTYLAHLKISPNAEELTRFDEKQVAAMLFKSLSVESKTVISHLILFKIFEPEKAGLTTTYNYKNDSINSPVSFVTFTYNSLSWHFNIENRTYSISDEEIDRIKNYWKAKLNL